MHICTIFIYKNKFVIIENRNRCDQDILILKIK